jgi:hypothetical protein
VTRTLPVTPDWSAWNTAQITMRSDITLAVAGLPDLPGIYACLGHADQLLYIGKAESLRGRWTAHHRAMDAARNGLTRLCWLPCPVDALDSFERLLIHHLNPLLNMTTPQPPAIKPESANEAIRLFSEGVQLLMADELVKEYLQAELKGLRGRARAERVRELSLSSAWAAVEQEQGLAQG